MRAKMRAKRKAGGRQEHCYNEGKGKRTSFPTRHQGTQHKKVVQMTVVFSINSNIHVVFGNKAKSKCEDQS
eukprot:6487360-Amphidinium_carterae.1